MRKKTKREASNIKRRLTCESLEQRELMAADVFSGRGELHIIADDHDDVITVSSTRLVNLHGQRESTEVSLKFVGPLQPYKDVLRVSVADETGSRQTQYFSPASIQKIFVRTGHGINEVSINAAIPTDIVGGDDVDTITGGSAVDHIEGGKGGDFIYGRGGDDILLGQFGEDTIEGGEGDDVLYGDGGEDTLYGGSENDELWGGDYHDKLFGDEGDDLLLGEAGHDDLYGGAGNDILKGGRGTDELFGGEGNDVLYGGLGPNSGDEFTTGPGLDRALVYGNDKLLDGEEHRNAELDAVIYFEDSTEAWYHSIEGEKKIEAASWTDEGVEQIDEALQLLFNATGNNSLLRKPDGGYVRLVRYGNVFGTGLGDGRFNIPYTKLLAFNRAGLSIGFTNNWSDNDDYVRTVVHEFGHYFDDKDENDFFEDFLKSTGWIQTDSDLTGLAFTRAASEHVYYANWYFPTSTINGFADNHGQTDPTEDFSTAFAAKILTDHGMEYRGEAPESVRDRMSVRFRVLDDFFASFA